MKIGLFSGSFDPLTKGYLDIIDRCYKYLFDQLIIAIGVNDSKKTMFSVEERIEMINHTLFEKYPGESSFFSVQSFDGLIVNLARDNNATIVRGVRNSIDFEYETNMANINSKLSPYTQTILLPTKPELAIVSSSATKEIAKHRGSIHNFVSDYVASKVFQKIGV